VCVRVEECVGAELVCDYRIDVLESSVSFGAGELVRE
jgi:hypothetical protein